jgi:hypothetical protein
LVIIKTNNSTITNKFITPSLLLENLIETSSTSSAATRTAAKRVYWNVHNPHDGYPHVKSAGSLVETTSKSQANKKCEVIVMNLVLLFLASFNFSVTPCRLRMNEWDDAPTRQRNKNFRKIL